MKPFFGLLYTLLFFSYVAIGTFVLFHILRYSISRRNGFLGAFLFITVLGVLLFTNALLFFSLPLDMLLPKNF